MRGRRWLIAGLLAGALLRGVLLPLPGTGDVLIWKVWSFAAAHDVTGVYGVGGVPPERRVLRWQGAEMTVDYPPVALYQLGVVGRIYHAARPKTTWHPPCCCSPRPRRSSPRTGASSGC
jgi:hypothetical protein